MKEPTTETGDALHGLLCNVSGERGSCCEYMPDILAIEAEARQQVYDLFASEEDAGHAQWTLAGIREGIDYLNEPDR